jgi:hypothetical protein
MTHKHATDREDVTIIAECPNVEGSADDHLQINAQVGKAKNVEAVKEEPVKGWPQCGECGSELDVVALSEPSEVIE